MNKQLLLNVKLRDDATFENFYIGDNKELLSHLHALISNSEKFIYLWGNAGSGKTHLLQAICHLAQQNNLSAIYFSLAQITTPIFLENLESLAFICIDDLDVIAGNPVWEEALFHCYNRVLQSNAKIIFAANVAPKFLTIKLSDLTSRLCASIIYQVHSLSDEQKIAALQLRANIRGMSLSKQVAEFLLSHYQRDSEALFEVLEKLDQATLMAKRKLTIPFVKTVLSVKQT